MVNSPRKKSALIHILLALILYSRENLKLAFHPNQFFNELEHISGYERSTLRTAYSRGQKRGLILIAKKEPKLTKKGFREVQPFIAKKLKNARLMIIFDIPEDQAPVRQQLRFLLKEWNFHQVQKSVWATEYDYKDILVETILELQLEKYVQLYESAKIFPQ